MKYHLIPLGTLKVKALEMIMGLPESLVRESYNVDEDGFMRIAMNALLLDDGVKKIIFDPGCATFLSKSLAETYDLDMEMDLEGSLNVSGYRSDEITDVIFTHLHFDHGSGAFTRIPGGIVKTFPNADYIVSRAQLEYIESTEGIDKSSFFNKLLRFAGELKYLEDCQFDRITFHRSHGHTGHMLVPVVDLGDRHLLYATDLVPMKLLGHDGAWSYYDEDRILLQQEKKEILSVLSPGSLVVYYHDPLTAIEAL